MEILDYVTLTPEETEKLISAGNAEAALLYLYIRATGDSNLQKAESRLRMSVQNLDWAHSLLKRLGLLDPPPSALRFDPERAPVYTGEAIASFAKKDTSFVPMQTEIATRLGRALSPEDMKILLSIRDYLHLPPEVITMALTCCIQKAEYRAKVHGDRKKVTMRTLERECYDWANQGIDTLEKAAAYISTSLEVADPIAKVRKALDIDRPFVTAERNYVESWLKYGFPVESIRVAYERTILKTGRLSWPYMDKILLNWHEKNLHTREEVTGETKRRGADTGANAQVFQPGAQERAAVSNLQSYLDSLKE